MRRRKVRAAKLIADGLWVDLRRGKYDRIRQLRVGTPDADHVSCLPAEPPLLLPPDLQEWVAPGHLAHHVSDVVDALDLTAFYAPYEGDGRRNAPYEPSMMVKVLIYAYATGTFSSRAVARKLEEDVAFRMLAAGNFPQHRTVCEFRRRHLERQAADNLGTEQLRGLIDFARDVLKLVTLINGGAAIALLAFAGVVRSAQSSDSSLDGSLIIWAIGVFTLGVLLSSIGIVTGYHCCPVN